MYLQIASVRNKLFSRSQSKTVKLLQIVLEEKWTRYFHVFITSTGLQANMMAFWLERFVGLGGGTRILFLFKNSMLVRQCAARRYSSSTECPPSLSSINR